MRHFDVAERRRRLLVRHHLAHPGPNVEQVAGDLVGLHSSDPATVVLAARARLEPFTVSDIEDALYERRTLLRMLAMRRTMFVVPVELAAVLDVACTQALVPGERRRLVAMLAAAGITEDADAWIERVSAETLAALRAHGPLAASQLTKLVPELSHRVRVSVGKRYESTIGMSTRLLFLLSAQGLIARARPLGTWQSSQYRWVTMADWVGELPVVAPSDARSELVQRWLRAYGAGTLDDVVWWTKWTKADARAALADAGAVAVTVDTGRDATVPGWALPGDLDDTPAALAVPDKVPPVALLPALDPTVMGWRHRAWYVGPDPAALFDRNGNAGPTVWVGGQVVGAWSQRSDGAVVIRLLRDVPRRDARRVDDAARELTDWMDGARVIPRFSTPLEKELAGR